MNPGSANIPDADLGASRLRTCRHGVMLFLAADQVIGRALALYGEFAESENALMLNFLQPGDTAIDVGANVGTVTLPLAARAGPTGRVYAFEPQRIVFQHLCASLILNGLTNVDARCAAAGAKAGTAHIPALNTEAPSNFGAVRLSAQNEGERVPLIAIDDLGLSKCALLKIDVEGMESAVLEGAEQTISSCRPVIYFEAKRGDNTRTCLRFLMERGYRLHWHFAPFFEKTNFRKAVENVFDGTGDINALALPKAHPAQVRLPVIDSQESDWQSVYRAWLKSPPK